MANQKDKTLRLILGDQLNLQHSWFQKVDKDITYVLMEVKSETSYTLHHIQKVIGFFAAMRHFANSLKRLQHHVIYIHLNDSHNLHSFQDNCTSLINNLGFTRFEYQEPDEYRVDICLKNFVENLSIPYKAYSTEHFYTSRSELSELFSGKKNFLMETFYRYMRKKHKVLVDKDQKPLNGKWNFDADNRKKLPASHPVISPKLFANDLSVLHDEINQSAVSTIGSVDSKNFLWPISRDQSLALLEFFIQHCLKSFGTYQDAMDKNEWSIYHSRLSFSLNTKMLSPKEVVDQVVGAYLENPSQFEYHQIEGFVRQILGWREYMRGIYWAKMPEYAKLNFFGHNQQLPDWFWTGNTNMNCLKCSIDQSLHFAYAHHIQRLMITGNFALLAGIDPDAIDAWYLGIYIDAIEWVEITNTRGMSQFADGGIVGTKPYVSSASYIHKMSNYCAGCHYDNKLKIGENACPFNSLYWNFYAKYESKLCKNPRIGMMYRVWEKMSPDVKVNIIKQAEYYLEKINRL